MNHLNRILVVSILSVAALAFGGCGKKEQAAAPESPAAAAPAETPATPPPATAEASTEAAASAAAPTEAAPAAASEATGAPAAETADAGAGDKGKQVYDTVCMVCHAQGVAGAPKLGDKAAWEPRIAQGMDLLHEHSLKGFMGKAGVMPPKGGRADLPDEDIKAGVDYMVNAAK